MAADEHTLEFLLAFDGRIHLLEKGYWLQFEIKRGKQSPERPHGLRYSFTLHDPEGNRLMGFDNAHTVAPPGSRFARKPVEHDHWHRTEGDRGRPYRFTTAEALLADFFAEVRRVVSERGISDEVVGVEIADDRRA
jgi:hypothetical protein